MLKSLSTTLQTSSITGTLGVPNGGTGLTTLTTGYIPYGNGTGAYSSSPNLTFNGTNLKTTGLLLGSSTTPLVDYKEGSFTPNQGSGLTVVGTFSSSATYTKIGRLVTINGSCFATSLSVSSVGAICSNLPFTVSGDYGNGSATNGTLTTSITVQVESTILYACSPISGTTAIYWSITYQV
jgi:hypothetical protein